MIRLKKLSQNGFATLESALLIVTVMVIGGIGWYAIHTKHQTDKILSQADKISQNTPNTNNSDKDKFNNCVLTLNQGAQLDESNRTLTCSDIHGHKYSQPALLPIKTISKPVTVSSWQSIPEALKKAILSDTFGSTCLNSKTTQLAGNFAVFDYGCDGGNIKIFKEDQGSWSLLGNWMMAQCDLVSKGQIPIEFTQYKDKNNVTIARCDDDKKIEHQVIVK